MMRDAKFLQIRIQLLILTTPVGLNSKNFLVKQPFNKCLELFEFLKNIRFVLKEIDPSKLTKIINKADIVFISSNRLTSGTPYIREYKLQRHFRNTRLGGVRKLVTLSLLASITDGV
jgi:hypothetical protein